VLQLHDRSFRISPTGVNVARIVINGNEWPSSTLKFHFVMAGQLRPNSSEFSDAIDRVRVFANSSLLEDLAILN
jgi:hypothetical protein